VIKRSKKRPRANTQAKPGGISTWEGVRNYQARNYIRQMRVGDRAFYYHSNCKEPGIIGIIEVLL
jgi:predicted RNA-binding protein with PUA-like domain